MCIIQTSNLIQIFEYVYELNPCNSSRHPFSTWDCDQICFGYDGCIYTYFMFSVTDICCFVDICGIMLPITV